MGCLKFFSGEPPAEGRSNILYVNKDTGETYIWNGSAMVSSGGGQPLETPELSSSVINSSQIDLSWTAVPNAYIYILERSLVSDFSSPVTLYEGSNLSFVNTGLDPNTTYYYRISALGYGYLNSSYSILFDTT